MIKQNNINIDINLTFIHYGCSKYLKESFKEIKNGNFLNKPRGGLWASPLHSTNSWRNFCLRNDFRTNNLNKYFLFKLKRNCKILVIDSEYDLIFLEENYTKYLSKYKGLLDTCIIDFEKIKEDGYDGIYLTREGESATRFTNVLSIDLYGWDVESIVIFNPNIIVPIKNKEIKIPSRNYKNCYLMVKTRKKLEITNDGKELLHWKLDHNTETVILELGNKYKSKKSFIRHIKNLLEKTKDDPYRIIIMK